MEAEFAKIYEHVRSGGTGYHEQKRGLIAVRGTEAPPFLDGLVTGDIKTLEDGLQIPAAFANAQGRLLAIARIVRIGERYIIDTEEATRQKVFDYLFRFTHAGNFFVDDLSDTYTTFTVFDRSFVPITPPFVEFEVHGGTEYAVDVEDAHDFRTELKNVEAVEIPAEVYEVLRIEAGIPKFGVDMDESTIVPEIGLDGMISYTKGCYIGQEIIARIHFRGHVAKRLTGIILSEPLTDLKAGAAEGPTLTDAEGKNAGRITSTCISPKLGKPIALAYVRYEHLADGTQLKVDGVDAHVKSLPFL